MNITIIDTTEMCSVVVRAAEVPVTACSAVLYDWVSESKFKHIVSRCAGAALAKYVGSSMSTYLSCKRRSVSESHCPGDF